MGGMREGGRVMTTRRGFDRCPMDSESVVAQAEAGQEPEVFGVADCEPVPLAGQRRVPAPLPVPPVRGRRGAFTLGRRGAGSPHESLGPLHSWSPVALVIARDRVGRYPARSHVARAAATSPTRCLRAATGR